MQEGKWLTIRPVVVRAFPVEILLDGGLSSLRRPRRRLTGLVRGPVKLQPLRQIGDAGAGDVSVEPNSKDLQNFVLVCDRSPPTPARMRADPPRKGGG